MLQDTAGTIVEEGMGTTQNSAFAGLVALCAVCATPGAQAEIYKCTDADGNVMYTQLPCEIKKPATTEPEQTSAIGAQDSAPTEAVYEEAPAEPRDAEAVAMCKKRYRDEIDRIDAEMRKGFTTEQGERYKAQLLELTQNLRRC